MEVTGGESPERSNQPKMAKRQPTKPASEVTWTDAEIIDIINRDNAVITNDEFVQLCTFLFGKNRWGKKSGDIMGCSSSTASHYRTGHSEPSPGHIRPLLQFARKHNVALASQRNAAGDKDAKDLEDVPEKTDKEIRFDFEQQATRVSRMSRKVLTGKLNAIVISGGPGTGKSYLVYEQKKALGLSDQDVIVYGGDISAPGLFKALHRTKDGGVLVLDDCDSALFDTGMLNILKNALDSTSKRVITYAKEAAWIKEAGLENSFEFKGSVIFITNYDISAIVDKGTSLSEHIGAVQNRGAYLDMNIRSRREMAIKIEMLIDGGMLNAIAKEHGLRKLSKTHQNEIRDFIMDNRDDFRQLSLRTVTVVQNLFRADEGEDYKFWKEDCEEGLMRKK